MTAIAWAAYGVVAFALFALWAISFRRMLKMNETARERLERLHNDPLPKITDDYKIITNEDGSMRWERKDNDV